MRKKGMTVFLALLLMVTTVLGSAAPGKVQGALSNKNRQTVFTIESDKNVVNVGDVYTITMKASNIEEIYAFDGKVAFDPEKAEFLIDDTTTNLRGFFYPKLSNDTNNEARAIFTLLGAATPLSGDKELCQLKFKALEAGKVQFDFQSIQIVDDGLNDKVITEGLSDIEVEQITDTSTRFTFSTNKANVKVGEEYKITISGINLKEAEGVQADIKIDPDLVEITDSQFLAASGGMFGCNQFSDDPAYAHLYYFNFPLNTFPQLNGSMDLFEITVKAISAGTAKFCVIQTITVDSESIGTYYSVPGEVNVMQEGTVKPTATPTPKPTATSWGTFGILIPIVTSVFPETSSLLFVGVSACLAGAVCGDHCSPISDTTIMSSAGARCNHVDHVATQLPYSLTVAAISFVMFLLAGFVPNAWICLPVGIVVTIGTLIVIKKLSANKVSE